MFLNIKLNNQSKKLWIDNCVSIDALRQASDDQELLVYKCPDTDTINVFCGTEDEFMEWGMEWGNVHNLANVLDNNYYPGLILEEVRSKIEVYK